MHFRSVFLLSVWISILIAAHPDFILPSASQLLWRGLASIGMDVALTPLTSDMNLMLDSNQEAFYQRQIVFETKNSLGWNAIAWPQLSFYGIRVPLLLMLELVEDGIDVSGHIHGICYHLNKFEKSIESFRVTIKPPRNSDEKIGLGREWRCL